jgi:hypothetical protein
MEAKRQSETVKQNSTMFEKSHGLGVLKPIHLESLAGKKAVLSIRESTKNS